MHGAYTKKGDLLHCDNRLGISLLDSVKKVFAKVIQENFTGDCKMCSSRVPLGKEESVVT